MNAKSIIIVKDRSIIKIKQSNRIRKVGSAKLSES